MIGMGITIFPSSINEMLRQWLLDYPFPSFLRVYNKKHSKPSDPHPIPTYSNGLLVSPVSAPPTLLPG